MEGRAGGWAMRLSDAEHASGVLERTQQTIENGMMYTPRVQGEDEGMTQE